MVQTLSPIGDRLGLILDPAILDQLQIKSDTPLEVTIEGNDIVIRPVASDPQARFLESARRMIDIHQETFRKLAE